MSQFNSILIKKIDEIIKLSRHIITSLVNGLQTNSHGFLHFDFIVIFPFIIFLRFYFLIMEDHYINLFENIFFLLILEKFVYNFLILCKQNKMSLSFLFYFWYRFPYKILAIFSIMMHNIWYFGIFPSYEKKKHIFLLKRKKKKLESQLKCICQWFELIINYGLHCKLGKGLSLHCWGFCYYIQDKMNNAFSM